MIKYGQNFFNVVDKWFKFYETIFILNKKRKWQQVFLA
jgi:hypothetical protein